MLRPKNNSYKVSDNDKKNSRGSKIRNPPPPPPPITFLIIRP